MPLSVLLTRLKRVGEPAAVCSAVIAFQIVLVIVVSGWARVPVGLWLPVAVVLGLAVIALVRRQPVAALALLLAGSVVAQATFRSWRVGLAEIFVADLALAFVAAAKPRRVSLTAAAATLGVQAAMSAFLTQGNSALAPSVAFLFLAVVTAWIIGDSTRERRGHAAELRRQAAAQAVTAERLRIARELHDVVAHSIGIIAIQAGMGTRVMDTQPSEARNALATIEATSRETLAGLRRTVSALRQTEPVGVPSQGPRADSADGQAIHAPLEPAPGLADVDRLAAATLDAGVRVDVQWRGVRRAVPADLDLAAYRIIQESLTNVVRHAGVSECRVLVEQRDDALSIEIVDDGRGRGDADGGYGIVGMRERVALLGGEFSAAPRPEGGFRVASVLPLPIAT
jgi:signal transduction histidine kinase